MSNAKLSQLPPEDAIAQWPLLAQLLGKADPYCLGRYDAESLREEVESGHTTILVAWDPETRYVYAAFAAEGHEYPGKRVFSIIMAGGENIDKWAHLWPAFRYVAKRMGFEQIQVTGRRGWKKFISAPEVGTFFVEDL